MNGNGTNRSNRNNAPKRPSRGASITAALLMFIVGGVVGYILNGNYTSIVSNMGNSTSTPGVPNTGTSTDTAGRQFALYATMRQLWTDHVSWTRDFISAVLANSAEQDAISSRLMKNEEDIGDAFAAYYGTNTGAKLTDFLKQHVALDAQIISAAKVNNTQKLNEATTAWQSNANDVADFLVSINPNWSQNDLHTMLQAHLDVTMEELQARIRKDWPGDITAADAASDGALKFADMLSWGIVSQFPGQF